MNMWGVVRLPEPEQRHVRWLLERWELGHVMPRLVNMDKTEQMLTTEAMKRMSDYQIVASIERKYQR